MLGLVVNALLVRVWLKSAENKKKQNKEILIYPYNRIREKNDTKSLLWNYVLPTILRG